MNISTYKIIIACLVGILVVSSVFLIISWIPPKRIQLTLESVSTDTYLDKYLFTTYPYQIQAEVTNSDETALSTGFNVEFYLNDTLLAIIPWLELAAGSSIKINYTWTPQMEGLYNLKTKIVGSNIEVTNNDLTTALEVYNESVNGYHNGLPFATYTTGLINGTVDFIIGNSTYKSGIEYLEFYQVWFNSTDLNLEGTVELARLYIYYTWYYGANPDPALKVEINDSLSTWTEYNLDCGYKDQKGFGTYNLPSGTLCYNVTSAISLLDALYILNITNIDSTFDPVYSNRKVSIYGAGLLIVMNDSSKPTIQYWINEGCDLLVARYASPENQPIYYPYTTSSFIKPTRSDPIVDATLISVVAGGDGGHNSLICNDQEWIGLYNLTSSNLAVDSSDVSSAISTTTNNIVKIVDQWHASNNGMTPSNAFLVVEY